MESESADRAEDGGPSDRRVVRQLPCLFRLAKWYTLHGFHKGRWRAWEWAARLSGRGRLCQVDLDCGLRVLVDLSDPSSRYPLTYGNRNEPVIAALVKGLLGPGEAFADVGANTGYYSLLAAARVGAGGHVYAIEPHPIVAGLLQANAERNGLRQLSVLPVAVGRGSGQIELHLPRRQPSGSATVLPGEAPAGCDQVLVPLTTLDEVLHEETRPLRALKIDVEGVELGVLEGAEQTLERHQPVVICAVRLATAREVLAWLAGRGYTTYRAQRSGLREVGAEEIRSHENVCAIPPERRAALEEAIQRV